MAIDSILNKFPAECGLVKLADNVGSILDENPTINKIVILVNYIFRTAMMVTFMAALPFSILPSFLISAGANIFYRLTIERFCQYRFAILSCLTAGAYELAKPAFLSLISGAAFVSISAFATALALTIPLAVTASIIFHDTNKNVNDKYRQMHPAAEKSQNLALAKCPMKKETLPKKSCCHS